MKKLIAIVMIFFIWTLATEKEQKRHYLYSDKQDKKEIQ
jgi:hypothetical protein